MLETCQPAWSKLKGLASPKEWKQACKIKEFIKTELMNLPEKQFCCYSQILWLLMQQQLFLRLLPKWQLPTKCPHDSTGTEHESAFRYLQEIMQQKSFGWVLPVSATRYCEWASRRIHKIQNRTEIAPELGMQMRLSAFRFAKSRSSPAAARWSSISVEESLAMRASITAWSAEPFAERHFGDSMPCDSHHCVIKLRRMKQIRKSNGRKC